MAKLDQKQLLETLSDIARCGTQRDYDALIGAVNALWSWGIISTKLYERVHSLDLRLYKNSSDDISAEEFDRMYDEYMEDKKRAPAEHGHWEDVGSLSCRCSECGCKNDRETRFCPNCGAKMDLEDKEYAEKHVL